MSRLQDLKEKGWRNMNSDERQEYTKLREQEENIAPKEPIKIDEPEREKTITLTEAELKELLKKNQEQFKEQAKQEARHEMNVGGWQEAEPEKKVIPTAKLRMYQKDGNSPMGVIIDFKKLRFDYNEDTRTHDKEIHEYTVLYDDGTEEKVEMSILDHAKINNYETVEMIETDRKKMVQKDGKILRSQKIDGYTRSKHVSGLPVDNMPLGSEWVDNEVVKYDEIHIVRRPNGQTLKIHNSRLNN